MEDIWVLEGIGAEVDHDYNTIIKLYSRNYYDRFETTIHTIKNYKPYFYIPAHQKLHAKLFPETVRVEEYVYKDAIGREVRKCFVKNHYAIKKLAKEFEFTCMSDYPIDRFYLTDIKLKYAYTVDKTGKIIPKEVKHILSPRVLMFDIEIRSSDRKHVPMPDNPIWPIVSVQIKDSYTGTVKVFTHMVPQLHDPEHVACASEQDLYIRMMNYIEEMNPDLLTGWNTGGYDIPYILERGKQININTSLLGRYGNTRTWYNPDSRQWLNTIPGRSTLDTMLAFKKFTAGQAMRESYSLKAIISDKDLLKDDAFEYTDFGPMIDELFEQQRWEEFIQYCKYDVIALDNINKHLGLIDFYENLRLVTGCKLDDVLYNSKIIEMFLLHEGMKPLPARAAYGDDESFQGAIVVDPVIGLHDWVGTFDLASLYPNIICGFNLSPDIDFLIPKTLKKTMDLREEMRALRKKEPDNKTVANMELCYKFLNNSFYGVMGLKTFRLYNKDIASTVTRYGRELNEFLQACARKKGYTVVAGDTDSVFIRTLENVTQGITMQDFLNDSLADWSFDHGSRVPFNLKFEKLYKKLLIKKKKMYCGHLIWEEGQDLSDKEELNYKGIELKRSDQCRATRETLYNFLKIILVKDDLQGAIKYVKEVYTKVLTGKIDIHEVAIPKSVRSVKENTPWARGIQNTQAYLDYNLPDGQKPRLIYIKPGIPRLALVERDIYDENGYLKRDSNGRPVTEMVEETIVMTEFCIDEEVDVSKIINLIDWDLTAKKTIEMKMSGYFEVLDMDFMNCMNGQQTIDMWF